METLREQAFKLDVVYSVNYRDRAFYIGCAVWAYKDWVGDFYPAKSRPGDFLKLYSQRMTAVEGNTTFYSVPDNATVKRWAQESIPGFQFCLKLPRSVTHGGQLMPHWPEALRFLVKMQPLGDRLGPFFAQLPPSYGPNQFSDLQAFLDHWPKEQGAIAVEVRHPDWFKPPHAERLNDLLRDRGVGRVLLDTRPIYDCVDDGAEDPQIASERRKPRLPLQPVVTAPFTLVRYIGHPSMAVNQPYFDQWVPRIAQWLKQGTQVYSFFHCPDESRSPAIARHFQNDLAAVVGEADLPPLPWAEIKLPLQPSQLTLFE